MRLSNAKAGRATPSLPAQASTRNSFGISNASAALTISKIPPKTAFSKSLTITPAKAGTIRLMMSWVILII
jgi:hypothetical protein